MNPASDVDVEERERSAQGECGYSAWDRIPNSVASRETRPIDEEVLLCEMRIGAVVNALNNSDRAVREALGEELRRRDLALRAALTRRHFGVSGLVILSLIAAAVTSFIILVAGAGWKYLLTVFAAAILLQLISTARPKATKTAQGAKSLRTIAELYVQRRCPDCEYDLSSTPDAISPEQIVGQRTGPSVCSECRSRWPLVPAPARFFARV